GDVRWRCRTICSGRENHRSLRARLQSAGVAWVGATLEDGQPDMHRWTGTGVGGRSALRKKVRTGYRETDCHHLQRRSAILANGESLQNDGGEQIRLRICGCVDGEGRVNLYV